MTGLVFELGLLDLTQPRSKIQTLRGTERGEFLSGHP